MFDEEIETEELDAGDDSDVDADDLDIDDVDDDVEDVDDVADDSVDDGSDAVVTPSRAKAKAAVSVDDLPSVEAKQKERDALAKAMEEFLARGGKVQEVENNIDV
ncbi:hypothetical protein [Denitrificimonas caeni]|uniref:hypothetical protein n=1 Tax=Denitrificimonas caeni TaxID=521720 RepID=UPI00196385DE|nr:hypothetical protein [Denitrificimonas caeni]